MASDSSSETLGEVLAKTKHLLDHSQFSISTAWSCINVNTIKTFDKELLLIKRGFSYNRPNM